ncbi:MAG TPA: TlpA disulfide reductase family protein [Actinotalea sp.]|nr:TlpA disulfide reductase family protein [Actinotalea sp.]
MRRIRGAQRVVLVVLAVAIAAAMVLSLAGCSYAGSSTDGGQSTVDRSVTTWDAADRPGPIDMVGTSYAGEPIDLAEWRGDVVLVNTWFAACPPCRAGAPDLVKIATEYAPLGLQAVGLNFTDDVGTAQAFERSFALPYPSLHDRDGSAVAALQDTVPLQAVPTTVLLDRQGRVAARILGLADPTTLRALIDDLLDEQA